MPSPDPDDPLTRALAPPPNEDPVAAAARLAAERAAVKHSDDIDVQLRRDAAAAKRRRPVKILLLGQSESGKSTVLKNFQRKYDPAGFERERALWRAVCRLNVVRSICIILDVLHTAPPDTPLTPAHRRLAMRLAPLREIEAALARRFRPASAPIPDYPPLDASVGPSPASADGLEDRRPALHVNGWAWQHAPAAPHDGEDAELARVLAACCEDMQALWADPVVRALLDAHRLGPDELNAAFLDDLARIAVPHYAPTDEDVLRARLKTLRVTEHHFSLSKSAEPDPLTAGSAPEVRIYDVGGARTQRHTWMPFFDDVNVIIFLAPISAFDQRLAEAPDVNRLEDTFHLWKATCSAPLLARVPLVLLLNKRDVLQRKLAQGVRFSRYVRSYRGRDEWEGVVKYLRAKFKAIQRELSPEPRVFYSHTTCATDTNQMSAILRAIEDLVLRRNLQDMKMM